MHGSSQLVLCRNPTSPLLPPHNPTPPTTEHTHTLALSPHFSTYTHSPVSISSLLLTTTGPFSPLPSLLAFCLLVVHKLGALGFSKACKPQFLLESFSVYVSWYTSFGCRTLQGGGGRGVGVFLYLVLGKSSYCSLRVCVFY